MAITENKEAGNYRVSIRSRDLAINEIAAMYNGGGHKLASGAEAKDDKEIMAVKHKEFNVYGLQFHPESILTPDGLTIIENFIQKVERGIL